MIGNTNKTEQQLSNLINDAYDKTTNLISDIEKNYSLEQDKFKMSGFDNVMQNKQIKHNIETDVVSLNLNDLSLQKSQKEERQIDLSSQSKPNQELLSSLQNNHDNSTHINEQQNYKNKDNHLMQPNI
jgi:hypothetical protein